jgi:hypothetical protein
MVSRYFHIIFSLLTVVSFSRFSEGQNKPANEKLWRYAIVVGANDGGVRRSTLKYAEKDAKEFAAILRSFGGVEKEDLFLILEPDRFEMESAFANMRRLLNNTKQSGTRQEVLVYYSGHSDERGLLIGDDDFPYREFREALTSLPADVRIAILDSCSSGALSRTKGGSRRAPFLIDSSVNVHGSAFMTSASADEAAQESDRIGGSFFTHYLNSGLRGAADADRNRQVTLNEAYNYAFQETLARTESTLAGPQHANYDFQLKGSGDIVLTDLRGTSALLTVSRDVMGRLFVRNAKGELLVEINKAHTDAIHLGLDPGDYTVALENPTGLFKGTVSVARGQNAVIRQSDLNRETKEIAIARGNMTPPRAAETRDTPETSVKERPVRVGVFPGGIGVLPLSSSETPERNHFAINLIGDGHYLWGMEASIFGSMRYYDVHGLQAAGFFNHNTAVTHGLQAAGLFNQSGDFRGIQASGIFNKNSGELFQGLQATGLFNINRGALYGLQASGLFNLTGEGLGLRASGLFNFTEGPTQGMHVAGLFNYVDGPTRGFTASGLFNVNTSSSHGFLGAGFLNLNYADSMGMMAAGLVNINRGAHHGFQGAGLVNVSATDNSEGFQAAGLVNYGERVRGFQAAGLVNVARESMTGLQVGLINVGGSVTGAQIGLVNVATAELKGAQIGLVNVGGGIYFAPTMWFSGSSFINTAFKLGGRYTYAILGYGVHPQEGEERSSLIYGIGGHLDFGKLWVDMDIITQMLMADYRWTKNIQDNVYKFRPTLGYRLLDQLSLYAGPSLNLLVSKYRREAELIPGFWSTSDSYDDNLRMSVDVVIGFQWEPQFGPLNQIVPLNQQNNQ